MKLGPIIGLTVIFLALGLGGYFFKGSLTPYQPFDLAKQSATTGATVQIMGAPIKTTTLYDQQTGTLNFTLQEPKTGNLMPVEFKSPKPDNFDEAVSVTAIGKYDSTKNVFQADNLLVKCPSKYAGQKTPSAGPRSYSAT